MGKNILSNVDGKAQASVSVLALVAANLHGEVCNGRRRRWAWWKSDHRRKIRNAEQLGGFIDHLRRSRWRCH